MREVAPNVNFNHFLLIPLPGVAEKDSPPTVPLKINNKKIGAYIDTACSRCCITERLAKKLPFPIIKSMSGSCNTATKETVTIKGQIQLTFLLGDRIITNYFNLLSNLECGAEIIIGKDLMDMHDLTFNTKQGIFWYGLVRHQPFSIATNKKVSLK